MNLKERAIRTHQAVVTDNEHQQHRIDTERREGRAARLNAVLGDGDLFFVPEEAEVAVKWHTRNIRFGDVRTITTTYDVLTDGSVDLGVKRKDGADCESYDLLTPCATDGCGEWIATSLRTFFRGDADERFAGFVAALGQALASAEGKVCADCDWRPCPTCGHCR